MKRQLTHSVFVIGFAVWAFLGLGECRAGLLQNMNFDTDLTGWAIGAVAPVGTSWTVQWSADHGASARMDISGNPSATDISQATLAPIYVGDQLTVNLYHTDMGTFSHWVMKINGADVLTNGFKSEGYESRTWTADQYYATGTVVSVHCAVWPGSSTTWVDSLEYTPVPEPTTLGLLTLGGLALIRRRRTA